MENEDRSTKCHKNWLEEEAVATRSLPTLCSCYPIVTLVLSFLKLTVTVNSLYKERVLSCLLYLPKFLVTEVTVALCSRMRDEEAQPLLWS